MKYKIIQNILNNGPGAVGRGPWAGGRGPGAMGRGPWARGHGPGAGTMGRGPWAGRIYVENSHKKKKIYTKYAKNINCKLWEVDL